MTAVSASIGLSILLFNIHTGDIADVKADYIHKTDQIQQTIDKNSDKIDKVQQDVSYIKAKIEKIS